MDYVSLFADLESDQLPHDLTLRTSKPIYSSRSNMLGLEGNWAKERSLLIWAYIGGISIEDFETALLNKQEELTAREIVKKAIDFRTSKHNSSHQWQTWDDLASVECN